jgi:hypothetical protein
MKHLIIFLGYSQSRLDNPVYRQFSQSTLYNHEVVLLYLSGRLDDRELLHQVNGLQKKGADATSDITFHLCTNLYGAGDAEALLQAVRIVRRQPRLQPDNTHTYPLLVYGLMPPAERCGPQVKQTVWRNLAQLNQVGLHYHDCPWIQCIFLYHDATQRSLCDFLYYTIHSGLTVADFLPNAATAAQTAEAMLAPIFGSFNSFGTSYPEAEVRAYLRMEHLRNVLRCARSAYNETSTTDCVRLAEELEQFVPHDLVSVALRGSNALAPAEQSARAHLKQLITQAIATQLDDLKDLRREEWAARLAKELDDVYQSRLLPGGVDYYFEQQTSNCARYSSEVSARLSAEFDRLVCLHRLPTDALRPVVRALVNHLQQRALELEHQLEEEQHNISASEHYAHQLSEAWLNATLLTRLTGRDHKIRERYQVGLTGLYLSRALVVGYRFALALLNEVIVNASALEERCVTIQNTLADATTALETAVTDASPEARFGIFDSSMLTDALEHMQQDQDVHLRDYGYALSLLFGPQALTDGYDLLSRVQQDLTESTDQYLDENIRTGRFPALLNTPIVDRLQRLYAAEGGYDRFIRVAKERAAIPLRLKAETATDTHENDRYLLLSSVEPRESVDKTLRTDDTSRVELLHLLSGVSLRRLDGFAGYRMAFEPTMF